MPDDGFFIGDKFASEWNRIRAKVDGAPAHSQSGQGPDGKHFPPIQKLLIDQPIDGNDSSSADSGPSARYTAWPIYGTTDNDPDVISVDSLGNVGSSTVEFWNLGEVGSADEGATSWNTSHLLPSGTPVVGFLNGYNKTTGKPIYVNCIYQQQEFWAKIVCNGPSGESNFTDNRYWFKSQYVSNTSSDPTEATQLSEDDSADGIWASCTNIFESCGSHKVRPDVPVRVWTDYDAGDPPTPRYTIIVGDTNAWCMEACHSSSSSQSSTSITSESSDNVCIWSWEVVLDCGTSAAPVVNASTTHCGQSAAYTLNSWQRDHTYSGPGCRYIYYAAGPVCHAVDECDDGRPDDPTFDPATDGADCCSDVCIWSWEVVLTCPVDGSPVVNASTMHCGHSGDYTLNAWTKDGSYSGPGCRYVYYKSGPPCSAVDDCGDERPDDPTFDPATDGADCCPSISSESSIELSSISSHAGLSSHSESSVESSGSGGSLYTGTLTVVTGWDASTCTVTTSNWVFSNGKLESVS